MNSYHVYILSNHARTLYIGVTSQLNKRIRQHKNKQVEGFTSRYQINQLVYFEEHSSPTKAIAREKQLKGWTRLKKIALIETINSRWDDLANDWN